MENIDFNVKRELMSHAKSMTDINECRQWCMGWCEEHHKNFTDVWYGFVRQAFLWGEDARMRERCIQAVKNTLKYFPTLDLKRMENWNHDDTKRHIEIYEANGEWKVKKIFGVEIRVDNPECCCFALRCSETHKRNDGVEYEWLQLLTTFDFETVKIDDKEERNMLWACSFRLNMGERYREPCMPSCHFESLEEFIRFYTKTTGDRIDDINKLVIVDDTPELIELDDDNDEQD